MHAIGVLIDSNPANLNGSNSRIVIARFTILPPGPSAKKS
jgi:hypothetical protein